MNTRKWKKKKKKQKCLRYIFDIFEDETNTREWKRKRRNKNVFDTSSTSLRNYNLIRGGEDFTDATLKESINRYFQRIYQRDKIEILKRFTISQERTSILIC